MPQGKILRHDSLSSTSLSLVVHKVLDHRTSNLIPKVKGKEQCNVVTLQTGKTLEVRDKMENGCHLYYSVSLTDPYGYFGLCLTKDGKLNASWEETTLG